MFRKQRIKREEVELDITSFMNLMIVLVPVLLMMMVFSHITILDLKLPQLSDTTQQPLSDEPKNIEIMVFKEQIEIYYPQTHLLKVIPADADGYDYDLFVNTLKQLKAALLSESIEKKDISLLLQEDTDYQTIISLMDKTRSYKAVVVASVVDAELFPEISLGDAPVRTESAALTASSQEVRQ